MARSVYRDQLWVPSASELLHAGVQIGLPETPRLAFDTGQNVALYSSLPGPCQQGARGYAEIGCGFGGSQPGWGLWNFCGNNGYYG